MAKLTKTQTANLNRIWTERVARGAISADRQAWTRVDARICARTGYAQMNANAMSSLESKGLVRSLVTGTEWAAADGRAFLIEVCVLTEAGRAAIGV